MEGLSFQGQLEGLILAVLGRGPLHGYAIASELRERSEGMLDVAEGTLYPVLHKLEKEGLIRSRWEVGNGRRRRGVSVRAVQWSVEAARAKTALGRLDRGWRDVAGHGLGC